MRASESHCFETASSVLHVTLEAATFAPVTAIHPPKGAYKSNSQGNDNENEEDDGITIAVVGTTDAQG